MTDRHASGRDAAVTLTGGSSTCTVAINGTTVGTLAAAGVGTFVVPAFQTITLTYTNASTWVWSLI